MTSNTTDARPAGGRDDARPKRLLEVDNLSVEFRTRDGVVNAVNGISYTLDRGETLAILGESGSGKSVSAQAVMGILDTPPGFITSGEIRFEGQDLLTMPKEERRRIRGERTAMIFQDALSSLNPVFPVGWQIAEMFRVHRGASKSEARQRAIELMDRVHIPSAKERVWDFPHQFSGGMRQRVMIAMALALDPDVLIADEPTTALDVTVQAQIMGLLDELQESTGMGLILITHDLGVVAQVADRIAVMYAGKIVETANIDDLYRKPGAPLHRGPDRVDPAAGPEGQGAGADRRVAAEPQEDPQRLFVPPPLPAGPGAVFPGRPAALRRRGRPQERMPLLRGGAQWLSRCFRCATWSSTSRSPRASSSRRSSGTSRPSTASAST